VGGVFTPTLFTGAALGLAAGHLLHNPEPSILAICGMGLLMSAVTHAPFMAAMMAVELSGQWHLLMIILPCSLLASFIARTISRESLYAIATPEPGGREDKEFDTQYGTRFDRRENADHLQVHEWIRVTGTEPL
jgi:CIC family chloride channel protein